MPALTHSGRRLWVAALLLAIPIVFTAMDRRPAVSAESLPAKSPSRSVVVALDGTGHYRSIQEAIDQAEAGVTITIAAGQYQEDVTIHSKDGLRLIGAGVELVTVLGRNRVGAFHIGKWPYGATNVEISGLTIKEHGGLALGIFNGRGVVLKDLKIDGLLFGQQVQDVRIERCRIGGSETTGAQFADSQVTLVGNFIHDNDHGVTVAGKSEVRLERNVITRNLFEGVLVTDQAHAVLVSNTIVKNGGGVAFLDNSRGEASGNIIGLNKSGVVIAPSSSTTLAHNAVSNSENNYLRAGSPHVAAPDLKPESDVALDPQFVDPNHDDYRLRAGTPLTEIGGFSYLGALAPLNGSR
jgi:parallel beta-helix repeat protein